MSGRREMKEVAENFYGENAKLAERLSGKKMKKRSGSKLDLRRNTYKSHELKSLMNDAVQLL